MAVRMIHCRNTVTGAVAEIPETALIHLTDYQPVSQAPDVAPGQDSDTSPSRDADASAADPPDQPATETGKPKSKAARAATTSKE